MKIIAPFLLLFLSFSVLGQGLNSGEFAELQKREDSLKGIALNILQAATAQERIEADSVFTRMFVRALSVNNSIQYPFDSLMTISKLTPADSSFRIYTWQLVVSNDLIRQKGAIQMRTSDGSLKLFPLIDLSDYMENEKDTVTSNLAWFGAVYYDIITKKAGNQSVYTLLGFDENNSRTNKKIVEILTFPDGKPVFGARGFYFRDSTNAGSQVRYIMEYKSYAGPRLTYDRAEDMIVFEHLISESNEPDKRETYVGDGDYDAFVWKNDRWVYRRKIFDAVTPEGNEPVPVPLLDAEGNVDRSKLKTDLFGGEKNDTVPAKKRGNKRKRP